MTIAPEMFSEEQLSRLIHSPLMLSIGHSEASFEEAKSMRRKPLADALQVKKSVE